MLISHNRYYSEIRDCLDGIPVIDTHEHQVGAMKPVEDVFTLLMWNYFHHDLISSAYGNENAVANKLLDSSYDFEKRFAIFEKYNEKAKNTAYSKAMLEGFRICWGLEEITRNSVGELATKMGGRDQAFYEKYMNAYGIKAKVVDYTDAERFLRLMGGQCSDYSKYCRFAFPLPAFHKVCSYEDLTGLQKLAGNEFKNMDDYVSYFEKVLKEAVEFGVVCCKDQSAYRRKLDYEKVSKKEASDIWDVILKSRNAVIPFEEVKALDDWLFDAILDRVSGYDLPVQIHTGHMAGNYNDIRKTNAAHLIPLMESHAQVKFSLFHGNWPYMDEYLFLGKNYPNAYLDLCWAQIIDPLYCIELMKRAIVTMPHSKLMAFGGDTVNLEFTIGYLVMARDNVACALSEMVESGWLGMTDAKQIAADWFFNNPNDFFQLNFEPYRV